MKMTKRFAFFELALLIFSSFCMADSLGEKLFKENKPKEAVQVLENEILNNQVSANTYNFLGLGYYQLEEYGKSIDAFERGLKNQPSNKKILSFNKGNTYYAMKDYTSAVNAYSQAYLDDTTFYDALLNRANSFLMADQLNNAKGDYELFLEKCPDDVQSPTIKKLIKAIEDEILRREEEARLLAEQNKALWEEIDPSIDETQLNDGSEWEYVDATIEAPQTEEKSDWQKVDAAIETVKNDKKPDWQEVDAAISENRQKKETPWEEIDSAETEKMAASKSSSASSDEKVETEKDDGLLSHENTDWEKLDSEHLSNINDDRSEAFVDDSNLSVSEWENLSDEEKLEMKRLEKESQLAHEKWLEEQSLLRQKLAEDELKKLQAKDDEERQAREQLLKDMMAAEEARRKKLLDDVANSLQNSESTNMTSGADELLEYEQEGVLD